MGRKARRLTPKGKVGQLPKLNMNYKQTIGTTLTICFFLTSSPVAARAAVLISPESVSDDSALGLPKTHSPVIHETLAITELVTNDCRTAGDEAHGSNSCKKVYSNGASLELHSDHEIAGDQFKKQTQMTELDAQGRVKTKKTVRQKINFRYLGDRKIKESEFFDIVTTPEERPITREFVTRQFDPKTGKLLKTSWTKYERLPGTMLAGISFHVVLSYEQNGSPLKGRAEEWRDGKVHKTIFSWRRSVDTNQPLDLKSWRKWEAWIAGSPALPA